MTAAGLDSLLPIDDFSIIGFAAIPAPAAAHPPPHAQDRARGAGAPAACAGHHRQPGLHALGRALRALARPLDPDRRLRLALGLGLAAGRARSMRRYIDHVLALLPFEPDVHRKLGGPPCSYVGHPLIEEVGKLRPNEAEAQRRRADPPIVLAHAGQPQRRRSAGSPASSARRWRWCSERVGPIEVVVPTVPHLLRAGHARRPPPGRSSRASSSSRPTSRRRLRIARAALAKSGTITLELAVAGVPMVAAYKVSRARSRGHPRGWCGCRPSSSPIW